MKKRTAFVLPEPPTPHHVRMNKHKDYLLIFVTLFLVVFVAKIGFDYMTGSVVYRDQGYYGGGYGGFGSGYGGFFSIAEFYEQSGYIIDALIFLLIFLGVGKGVFKNHFKEGGTAAYTGIGFFLAFALLLWEERTGYFLLYEFGPYVMAIFGLVMAVWLIRWFQVAGIGIPAALSLVYILVYFAFLRNPNSWLYIGASRFWVNRVSQWAGLLDVFLVIAIPVFLWCFFTGFKKKNQPLSVRVD
jgi:hypothetical protein